MRCAECGLYECSLRTPSGGCPNGEKTEMVEIIPSPNTGPCVIDPNKLPPKEQSLNDEQVKVMEAIVLLTTRGWTCITPDGIDVLALKNSAQDLVEAVDGYIAPKKGDKYVFRNEVLEKCNKVKKLLGK